jgi:hypothetical protein
MSPRKSAISQAIIDARTSSETVKAASKEWVLAHDKFSATVCAQPGRGRTTGSQFEHIRLHAQASYENLLDQMRVHAEDLARLAALKGRM